MKCANCSSEAPDGAEACPLCQCVFPRAAPSVPPMSDSASVPVPVPAAVSSAPGGFQTFETITASPPSKAPTSLYVAALLMIAGVAWFFMRPIPGLPVPAGAYEDVESHFAVSPVAQGWVLTSTKVKKGELVEAVAFRKLDGEGPLRASFVVFVYPKPLPDFTEKGKPQLISAASDGLSAVYEGHRQETVQDATVDNLKALRLTGLLSRKAAPVPPPAPLVVPADMPGILPPVAALRPPPPPSDFEYKTTAMLVPGTDKAYLLVAMAPAPESGALQPLFDAAFASFRVTARPLAHQQAVNEYSRLAAIAGAALLLLLFAYKIIRGILS